MRFSSCSRWPLGCLFALASHVLFAAISIDGPATVEPYKLVRLSATGEATKFAWSIVNSELVVADFVVLDGGKDAAFTGPPGRYLVTLVGSDAEGVQLVQRSIVIGTAPAPTPVPPGPTPPKPEPTPPGPTPPKPDFERGRFDLARLSYEWSSGVKSHRELAAKLAENYEFIANGIHGDGSGSRSFASIKEAQAKLREVNGQVLGSLNSEATKAWMDWLTKWTTFAASQEQQGKVDFPDGLEALYRETATGLRAVK